MRIYVFTNRCSCVIITAIHNGRIPYAQIRVRAAAIRVSRPSARQTPSPAIIRKPHILRTSPSPCGGHSSLPASGSANAESGDNKRAAFQFTHPISARRLDGIPPPAVMKSRKTPRPQINTVQAPPAHGRRTCPAFAEKRKGAFHDETKIHSSAARPAVRPRTGDVRTGGGERELYRQLRQGLLFRQSAHRRGGDRHLHRQNPRVGHGESRRQRHGSREHHRFPRLRVRRVGAQIHRGGKRRGKDGHQALFPRRHARERHAGRHPAGGLEAPRRASAITKKATSTSTATSRRRCATPPVNR